MIADGAEGLRDELRIILAAKHKVVCAADGTEAWELFLRLQPDLLVMDVELPEIDGITLLRRIRAAGFHPGVIIIGRLLSDYTVDTLIQMKVDYILRKPCKPSALAERAEELLQYQALVQSPVRAAITRLLCEFGIPPRLHGSKYLLSAIILMAEDPSQYITKELYPSVGKEYGLSGGRVERCIRNAVKKGWENGGKSTWQHYFGADHEVPEKGPMNQVFIRKMVELLRKGL